MHEHPRALDVAQEAVAEPGAAVRALDQARHVHHHERLFRAQPNDTELRLERRERIVGNLRPRGRDGGKERRLAGVGQPHDAAVGQQFEFEPERGALGGFALLGEARRLTLAGREMLVAEAASAAFGHPHLGAGLAQVGDEVLGAGASSSR